MKNTSCDVIYICNITRGVLHGEEQLLSCLCGPNEQDFSFFAHLFCMFVCGSTSPWEPLAQCTASSSCIRPVRMWCPELWAVRQEERHNRTSQPWLSVVSCRALRMTVILNDSPLRKESPSLGNILLLLFAWVVISIASTNCSYNVIVSVFLLVYFKMQNTWTTCRIVLNC